MHLTDAFFAYSSEPDSIVQTIETAAQNVKSRSSYDILTWKHLEVCGHFIADQVLTQIENRGALVADITRLNFNVVYEIGFAIGKSKPVYIVRNASLNVEPM